MHLIQIQPPAPLQMLWLHTVSCSPLHTFVSRAYTVRFKPVSDAIIEPQDSFKNELGRISPYRALFAVQCTRGEQGPIICSLMAVGWSDEFLTSEILVSRLRLSHSWSRTTFNSSTSGPFLSTVSDLIQIPRVVLWSDMPYKVTRIWMQRPVFIASPTSVCLPLQTRWETATSCATMGPWEWCMPMVWASAFTQSPTSWQALSALRLAAGTSPCPLTMASTPLNGLRIDGEIA